MEIIFSILSLVISIIVVVCLFNISNNTKKTLRIITEIALKQGVDKEQVAVINDPDYLKNKAYREKYYKDIKNEL